jgi:hypothetical protein
MIPPRENLGKDQQEDVETDYPEIDGQVDKGGAEIDD